MTDAPRTRVVITNHDPVFLELLQQLLQEEGYDALVPPQLSDPYPFIKEVLPAVVLLDAPFRQETAALGVLDKLRLDPDTAAVTVVVCSTSPQELQGLEHRLTEGLYLLAKPFDLEQLLTIVMEALRLPQRRGAREG
jgi:DNA-binding response OmpR family regulator